MDYLCIIDIRKKHMKGKVFNCFGILLSEVLKEENE